MGKLQGWRVIDYIYFMNFYMKWWGNPFLSYVLFLYPWKNYEWVLSSLYPGRKFEWVLCSLYLSKNYVWALSSMYPWRNYEWVLSSLYPWRNFEWVLSSLRCISPHSFKCASSQSGLSGITNDEEKKHFNVQIMN